MYEQEMDKLIKLFEYKQEKGSLLFSIFSYKGGIPKLGITRSFEKKDGTIGYSNSGRLNIDEIKFFKNNYDEIINIIEKQTT